MAFELSEALNREGALCDWANKVTYNMELSQEEKEISEYVDQWAKEIGRTGYDRDHELSAYIEKSIQPDVVSAPSELISRMFNEDTIGEFDDTYITEEPRNTIQVHEAIIEGNVDRSFIEHKVFTPEYITLAAETDISMQDLRRGGYRTVANLTQFIRDALDTKRVQKIMQIVDTAITSGMANYIVEATANPTAASMDALALYLHDVTDGEAPVAFSLNKYRQAASKLAQAERWPTEAVKSIYNNTGFIQEYAGVEMLGFSAQKKLPDGSLIVPDKRIFGIAGKIGSAITRGDTRVLQEEDINQERVHIKVTGYTFGWAITDLTKVAKMVLA